MAGPDGGKGGKYLFLPPGYDGDVPDGYFVARSQTYSNWLVIRALDGVESLLTTRIYPLATADSPPETEFVNFARAAFNGIHSNDFAFFEEINTIVQEEPAGALDPERTGRSRRSGSSTAGPSTRRADARHPRPRGIGAGIARTLLYKPRDRRAVLSTRRILEDRLRRRQPRVPRRRRPAARLPHADALRRHRHHPGDDRGPRRRRIPVRLHRRGLHRRVARRSQPTRCAFPQASPPRRSGRSTSTTPRPEPCCRPTTRGRASTAPANHPHRTQRRHRHPLRTHQAPRRRPELAADRARQGLVRRSCGSTDPSSRGSTRRGDPARSNRPADRPALQTDGGKMASGSRRWCPQHGERRTGPDGARRAGGTTLPRRLTSTCRHRPVRALRAAAHHHRIRHQRHRRAPCASLEVQPQKARGRVVHRV